ncbi:hypothetical protein K505DRAFT_357879 [Melanomma pulvis-pyrius CBS 109.77]|uniref:Uncharacterized protein n=1 Tax=Melanomma pulvis-pyrius CBS 109.77 TaxID=1314802 RepID=A0A6A6XNM3_9PLEO|nr:hypothetical protein K505DRAFT_357879 [Melanomma pulvis-pyrius CBS 109.77]
MALNLASTSNPTGIKKPQRKRARKVHPKVLGPLTTPPPSPISPLLSLPPEIRSQIWRHAMTTTTGELVYSSVANGFQVANSTTHTHYTVPGLATTCHQIALETQHLALKVNRLIFPEVEDLLQFSRLLFPREAALGRLIEIRRVVCGVGETVLYLKKTKSRNTIIEWRGQ